MSMHRARGLLRAPLLHFILLGGGLFVVSAWRAGVPADDGARRITVSRADLEAVRNEWARRHGVQPAPAMMARLVADSVDEELLHREALAAGLDRTDPLVRDRLARLGSFLATREGESAFEDEAREAEARRLGLAEHDVVIRRHLIQAMRLALARLAPADLPTEAELETYLAQHSERFARPARVRLSHVYFARARGLTPAAAAGLRDALARDGLAPEAAVARGDAFVHGAEIRDALPRLDAIFGPGFGAAVAAAPLATWVGPIASAYGLHLVWVHGREPAAVPALAAVRSRVVQALLEERREARLRERLALLRARYDIRIDAPLGASG
jgi:parvulin-like peptidyl-prolyl isomerase